MGQYAKAIVGAIVSGLGALEIALVDNAVTMPEWVRVAAVTLAALGLVWGVQNDPPKPPAGV